MVDVGQLECDPGGTQHLGTPTGLDPDLEKNDAMFGIQFDEDIMRRLWVCLGAEIFRFLSRYVTLAKYALAFA